MLTSVAALTTVCSSLLADGFGPSHKQSLFNFWFITYIIWRFPSPQYQDMRDPFPTFAVECFVSFFNLWPTRHSQTGINHCMLTFVGTESVSECVIVQNYVPFWKVHEHRSAENLKSWVPTWTTVECFPVGFLANVSEWYIWGSKSHRFL